MTNHHDDEPPLTPTHTLDVRRADHDTRGLARHIAELITEYPGVLVDLSAPEDHGNRIVARAQHPSNPPATPP